MQMIDLGFIFRYLDVAMATNFVKNGKLCTFVALAFRNGMGYRYLNVRIDSANDASISWQHSYVSVLPARGPSGLYARLCHAFLVIIYCNDAVIRDL